MLDFDTAYQNITRKLSFNDNRNFFAAYLVNQRKFKKIVLYGAGANCNFAALLCATYNIPISYICDSAKKAFYTKDKKWDIISPSKLAHEHFDATVLITSWKYEKAIHNTLINLGVPDDQIYYFRYPDILPLSEFENKYLQYYRQAYDLFTDNRSKQRILDRINLYLLGQPYPSDSLHEDGYFMSPYFKPARDDVYIDVGVYTGDTIEQFINACQQTSSGQHGGIRYKYIYGFEADPNNYKVACKNLIKCDKLKLIPSGLWETETILSLNISEAYTQGLNSNFGLFPTSSTIKVPVTTLDIFFQDKPQDDWPTLIKMDIEGAEKKALLGCTKVIQAKKPRLAISIYHKPEDIYELPKTIMDIRKDYNFTLWQIGAFWDFVLYAY